MHAAVYARVSTERQERQQTIDSQLVALRAWAESNGHDLNDSHVFRDEGYSGARLDRPGLDALRDAVRDGEVDIVAVLAPDRLARRYAYQVLLLEEFRRVGCAVAFLNRAITDDPGDQLLLQIQGAVAEYERALLGGTVPPRQTSEGPRRPDRRHPPTLRVPLPAASGEGGRPVGHR